MHVKAKSCDALGMNTRAEDVRLGRSGSKSWYRFNRTRNLPMKLLGNLKSIDIPFWLIARMDDYRRDISFTGAT